jgi:hypothetical protein
MASRPPDTRQPKLTFSSRSPELQRKTREYPNLKIRSETFREILTGTHKQKIRLDALRDILRRTHWAKKNTSKHLFETLVRLLDTEPQALKPSTSSQPLRGILSRLTPRVGVITCPKPSNRHTAEIVPLTLEFLG